MVFKIIIDGRLLDLIAGASLAPAGNMHMLSLLNDFEDGRWRFEQFQSFIWDNIAETALSHRERTALKTQPHSLLVAAAKNLRLTDSENDIGKGSELAEIVLYGIMKHHYNALPVVPKIFYKQNTQDNVKGADSVHIVLGNGQFSLWFGEAKFYNSIEDTRLPSIIQSIKGSLATDKLKKENSIITNVSDIDHLNISDAIRAEIKECLSNQNSIDGIKSKIHVPILLLHQCDLTAKATELTDAYMEAIKAHHMDRATVYFSKQIEALAEIHKYADIHFHLILFPVPEKAPIVDRFIANVVAHKG